MSAYVISGDCCMPSSETLFFCSVPRGRIGAVAPQNSRVSASLRSIPPLRYGMDTPLTSFTPLRKEQVSGFLRKPCFSFFFCLLPRCPRYVLPELPLCIFLLGWRTFPQSWRSGFCQALPDDRRAPEGRGLERIRGASYALNVPAKQKPSPFVSS